MRVCVFAGSLPPDHCAFTLSNEYFTITLPTDSVEPNLNMFSEELSRELRVGCLL